MGSDLYMNPPREPDQWRDRALAAEAERTDLREQLRGAVETLRVIANDTTHDGRWAAGRAEVALVAMGVDPRLGGQ